MLYDSRDWRDREALALPRLMRTRVPATVPTTLVATPEEALREAWALVRPGDRLVMIVDEVAGVPELLHWLAGPGGEDARGVSPVGMELVR